MAAAGMLQGDLGCLCHADRVTAEDLGGGGVFSLPQLEQRNGLFILKAQGLGADHLGTGQPRPLLPADGTERQVCHPRHRGQRQRDMDLDSSDFNHGDLLEIKHTEWAAHRPDRSVFYHIGHRLTRPPVPIKIGENREIGGICMEWKELRAALRGLTIYQEPLETEIGQTVTGLLDALYRQDGEGALAAYTGLFAALCRAEFHGLGDWLWDWLRCHESAYSLLIDQGGSNPVLEQAARQDVNTLAQLAGTGYSCFLDAIQPLLPPEFAPVLAGLPQWRTEVPFDFDTLTAFYREHGAGLYAKYRAFLWEDGSLIPVADPDCPAPKTSPSLRRRRSASASSKPSVVRAAAPAGA